MSKSCMSFSIELKKHSSYTSICFFISSIFIIVDIVPYMKYVLYFSQRILILMCLEATEHYYNTDSIIQIFLVCVCQRAFLNSITELYNFLTHLFSYGPHRCSRQEQYVIRKMFLHYVNELKMF